MNMLAQKNLDSSYTRLKDISCLESYAKAVQAASRRMTARLLSTIFSSHHSSKTVHVEEFSRQFEYFEKNGNKFELGGDFNLSRNVFFNGVNHSLVINGDAMGKSVFGAAGALIFGTAFQHASSHLAQHKQLKLTPAEYLKQLVSELHKVLLDFEDQLLISAVFLLINNETGSITYFNAAHPRVLLLRGGLVSYFDAEAQFSPLGWNSGDSSINTCQQLLLPGDCLFCGSDGKDDVIIKTKEPDLPALMSHDRGLFLRLVQMADGNLEQIISLIDKYLVLQDDVSILKVCFNQQD